MIARKSSENALTPAKNGAMTDTPESHKRKRERVDWSSIDQKGTFHGFELKPLKASKKRRSMKDLRLPHIVQPNVFDGCNLSETQFTVTPPLEWDSTGRYKKFTIGQAEFQVGDIVYIRADESEIGSKSAPLQAWVAKVLEVRAGDENHVYLRVYWMYRPEDLPSGRLPHHGRNELIATNDMAIIDAMTVDGPADVVHWQERQDQGEILHPDQLFWRQTLDVTKKSFVLSKLPMHCVDNAPCNPDQLLIQCSSCSKWLHGPCIEKAALHEAYESFDLTYPEEDTAAKDESPKRKRKAPLALLATINSTLSGKTRLTITDRRLGLKKRKTWDVPIKCLFCEATIEDVEEPPATDADPTEPETPPSGIFVSEAIVPASDAAPHTPPSPLDEDSDEAVPDSAVGKNKMLSSPLRNAAPPATSGALAPPEEPNGNDYVDTTPRKSKRRATTETPGPSETEGVLESSVKGLKRVLFKD